MENSLGWITILPPVIAIVIALISKEVVFSLLIGILSGTLILSNGDLVKMLTITFKAMSDKIGDNANILIFLGLMGVLVALVTKAGGSTAYGSWAAKKIKTRRGVLTATATLGCMIFIDDYFNCLTVGSVMKPVTDKHKISRVRLAYILDSTAAPICILAPISSWGASISTYLQNAGLGNGMSTFIQLIPYNLYAIFTVMMVFYVCTFDIRLKKMAKVEDDAIKNGVLSQAAISTNVLKEDLTKNKKGRVCDLVIPILSMIIGTIAMMIYTGGGFTSNIDIFTALGKCNSSLSLIIGSFISIIVALIMYIPRKVISFKEFTNSISEGIQSMVSAFTILILAWTISEICSKSYLNTGEFIANVVKNSNFPMFVLPVVIFIVSGFLGFATGTSWGTMAILIPVCAAICNAPNTAEYLFPVLGGVLAGAVFGDHISPISDTTILSSAGAQCNHLDHVSTQLPYALLVAGCCSIGYLLMGFFKNALIPLGATFVVMILLFIILAQRKRSVKK